MPKAGLYQRGLLKSLMDRAIPSSPLMIAQTVIASLYLSLSVFGSVCHENNTHVTPGRTTPSLFGRRGACSGTPTPSHTFTVWNVLSRMMEGNRDGQALHSRGRGQGRVPTAAHLLFNDEELYCPVSLTTRIKPFPGKCFQGLLTFQSLEC